MHIAPLIQDLAVILAVAGVVTLVFRKLKQPVVLGYIVAGTLVAHALGPTPLISDTRGVAIWAELGLIFLMFSLGLDFSFRKLSRVGISAGMTALLEVTFMNALGFLTGQALGFGLKESFFLGAMVSISSTTIIVRALDEMGLRSRRFADMILAILIVEDLIAILLLVALSTFGAAQTAYGGLALFSAAAKLVLVVGVWFITGYFVVPRVIRFVGRVGSSEMLTIVSIALCLGLVLFSAYLDYSVALGAFVMGSILSESTESQRIEERIEPLRDLFAAIFFVSVGMMIDPRQLWDAKGMILLFSSIVIFGKILGVTLGSLITGQTLRSAVQVGFGLAQIGEFSFIIITLGLTLKAIPAQFYPLTVAVSVLTTFTTPYLIRVSHKTAVWIETRLPQPLQNFMMQYVTWARERAADTGTRKLFYRLFLIWFSNGLIVSAILLVTAETLLPWLKSSAALGWLLAIVAASPFIWAMLASFKNFGFGSAPSPTQPPKGGTLLLFRLISIFWIATLSLKFFSLQSVAALGVGAVALLFFLFYRHLEKSYKWFEQRFFSTFNEIPKTQRTRNILKHLAPWDAHLVRLKVHPNAEVVQKTIAQAHLRSRFGVNIVVIQRGIKSIVAPKPEELILPKDELLVLGTDEQIDTLKPHIEKPPGLADRFISPLQYELIPVRVIKDCAIVGKSMKDSGIREGFGVMVVGIERGNKRMINPQSDLQIQADDILWAVGAKDELTKLCTLCATACQSQPQTSGEAHVRIDS